MIPAEYILMKKLGKHYLIDSYENNLQKDNKIKKWNKLINKVIKQINHKILKEILKNKNLKSIL